MIPFELQQELSGQTAERIKNAALNLCQSSNPENFKSVAECASEDLSLDPTRDEIIALAVDECVCSLPENWRYEVGWFLQCLDENHCQIRPVEDVEEHDDDFYNQPGLGPGWRIFISEQAARVLAEKNW